MRFPVAPALAVTLLALPVPASAQEAAPVAPATAQPVALPGAVKARPAEKPGEVAKRAPINGVLVLYGNERCPTNTDGQEIVVCERRSAQEQYRVPKELRDFKVTPENEAWAQRAQGTLDTGVGVSSTGSCSVVGPGGQTGCFAQQARATKAANKERKADEARVP